MLIFKSQLACAIPKSVCCLAPELDENSWGMAWACLELAALSILQLSDSIICIFGSQEAVTLQLWIVWKFFLIILGLVTRYVGVLQKVLWYIFIRRGSQSLSLTCQLAHGNGLSIQSSVVSAQDNGFSTHPWSQVIWVGWFLLCSMIYMTCFLMSCDSYSFCFCTGLLSRPLSLHFSLNLPLKGVQASSRLSEKTNHCKADE